MKSMIFFFLFCNLFLFSVRCESQTNSDFSEVKITKMIKDFYFSYYFQKQTVNNKNYEAVAEKLDSIINRYCTLNLINQIRDVFDYDPFVDSQSFEVSLLSTFNVTKDKNFKDLYYASYDFFGSKKTIRLIVVEQFNQYKIDYLWLDHKL